MYTSSIPSWKYILLSVVREHFISNEIRNLLPDSLGVIFSSNTLIFVLVDEVVSLYTNCSALTIPPGAYIPAPSVATSLYPVGISILPDAPVFLI